MIFIFGSLQDRAVDLPRGLGARRRGSRPGVAPLFPALVWVFPFLGHGVSTPGRRRVQARSIHIS
eukprot:10113424-Alexandrium_andersonii.AAC.1